MELEVHLRKAHFLLAVSPNCYEDACGGLTTGGQLEIPAELNHAALSGWPT